MTVTINILREITESLHEEMVNDINLYWFCHGRLKIAKLANDLAICFYTGKLSLKTDNQAKKNLTL